MQNQTSKLFHGMIYCQIISKYDTLISIKASPPQQVVTVCPIPFFIMRSVPTLFLSLTTSSNTNIFSIFTASKTSPCCYPGDLFILYIEQVTIYDTLTGGTLHES